MCAATNRLCIHGRWRQNAWAELLAHHGAFGASETDRHVKLKALLSDAFLAPGAANGELRSADTLEGKTTIALFFDDGTLSESSTTAEWRDNAAATTALGPPATRPSEGTC
mgnify:CR=1 FL=1